jgi:AraC-like DNA-binding protein
MSETFGTKIISKRCIINTLFGYFVALFDYNSMKEKFKYVTASEEDMRWGLFINVAGCAKILANSNYPLSGHPDNYYFRWSNGRTLDEFQINYITDGSGIMETNEGKFRIFPGTMLFLFPGVWHRYKPDTRTGWTEHFIGFNGLFTERIFQHEMFKKYNPVLKIGFQESLLNVFNEIIDLAIDEKPGYQQECAGKLLYIFGHIISVVKNSGFANKEIERNIRKANLYMRDNLNKNISIEELAAILNVSYSTFRKMYKKYTGMSPNQYHLGLRIQKSKEMLLYSEKSVKEVAHDLGFESVHYFSRIFRKKEGIPPSWIRIKPDF